MILKSVVSGNRKDLLNSLPKGGTVAEIGTFMGNFALEIIERCSPKFLFIVDLFEGRVTSGDENGENLVRVDMVEVYPIIKNWETLSKDNYISIVKDDSSHWLDNCRHSILDWVYIDTTHTFEQTTSELWAAARAVRKGGLIMGHDYHPQFGVVEAVDKFCEENGLDVEIWNGDKLPSYRIVNLAK